MNCKRCNETSKEIHTDSFIIDIELSKLFCVEMDYLDIGVGLDTEKINYIQLGLYSCNNGIDFNKSDGN